MNIIQLIQDALTALNSDAEVLLLEQSRAENEELEHTGDTIIVYPDWTANNEFSSALEINTTRTYNIVFKTIDEWDNSDNKKETSYNSKTSVDRIEEMTTLSNSVMRWIANNRDEYEEIVSKPSWSSPRPILRENNGTMSGVVLRMSILLTGNIQCNFDKTVEFQLVNGNQLEMIAIPEVLKDEDKVPEFDVDIETGALVMTTTEDYSGSDFELEEGILYYD